ncbi:MAG: phosphopantetheine-binding protein [Anaerolineaceae bacterium]|nr:phosphopantetheine-binding protein [Anaerolineaceae bacterium]
MSVTIEDIKRIVSLQLGIREIGDDDRFLEDLRAESADVMIIISSIEEKYGVVIKESEIPELHTPTALYMVVKNRM